MSNIERSNLEATPLEETKPAGGEAQEAQPVPQVAGSASVAPVVPPADAPAPPETPCEEGKRPISARKLAANRANAQLSTGPRTTVGKDKSKLNATTHGFTARYLPPPNAETPEGEKFEAVFTELHAHYQPNGALERLLVGKLVMEYMRYLRIVEREQALTAKHPTYFHERVNKLARYQTAVNNQVFQAIRELERVQARRHAEEEKGESAEQQ